MTTPVAADVRPQASPSATGHKQDLSVQPKDSLRKAASAEGSGAGAKLDVHRWTLQNGLTVLHLRRPGPEVVAIHVRVQGDSRFDPDEKAGLSQFTGKMLQEGTAQRDHLAIAEAIDFVGGSLTTDETGIRAHALATDFPQVLDLVADCLVNASFPKGRVDHVRETILAEIAGSDDDPAKVGLKALKEMIYEGHPYHHPTAGYKSTVQGITRDDLVAHHRRYYTPQNTLVAIVGNVDPDTARAQAEKAFSSWQASGTALPKLPELTRKTQGTVKGVFMDKEQLNIYLGHLGIRRSNPDYYAVTVMDHILGTGAGFTDRMSRILRDELGLAYTVWGDMSSSSGLEPGRFTAFIGTSPKNRTTSVREMTRLIREIRDTPVTTTELRDAVDYITGSFVFRFETTTQLAEYLIGTELYGLGADYLARYPERIRSVTVADVARVARQYLSPEALSVVIVGPVDEKGDVRTSGPTK